MGQSNNFDGPLIIDELGTNTMLNTVGFGRAAYSVDRGADSSTGPRLGPLNVDPSAGAGVASPLGSLALRYTPGFVQVWQKTTAPDTGWTLLGGGASASATQYVFVWSEGNPAPHDNVYANFTTLYAAAIAVDGEILVDVDALSVNPAIMDLGTYDLTKFKFTSSNAIAGGQTAVTIREGVVWSEPFSACEYIAWEFTNTTEGSVYKGVGASDGPLLLLGDNSSMIASIAAIPLVVSAGASFTLAMYNSGLFATSKVAGPVFGVSLTSTLHVVCEGISTIGTGSIHIMDVPALANTVEIVDNTSGQGQNNLAGPTGTGDYFPTNIRRTLYVRDADQGTLTQEPGDEVVRVDCTGGNQIFTLFAATDNEVIRNQVVTIKKNDATANTLTINGGGTNIDGAATLVLTAAWQVVTLMSDGALWSVVSN